MDKKNRKFLFFLLLTGAVASFGAFLFWPQNQKSANGQDIVRASTPEAQALVNKHLFLTAQSQELAEQQRKIENTFQSPRIGDSIWPAPDLKKKSMGVDHSPDRHENNAYQDLQRDRKEWNSGSPDHIIQGQLADQEAQLAYMEKYREEYVRQFIENARRNGYHVELDDNYVVIRVSPIRGNASSPEGSAAR